MIKAAGGGGGKGMKIVEEESQLENLFLTAKSEAKKYFGNDDQKAVISESMVVPQLSKEYLSDMCCIVDSSMVVMFNFISKVLTFEFSGFQDYIADLKEDDRFTTVSYTHLTLPTKA